MKTPFEKLSGLVERHAIPSSVNSMPEWLEAILAKHQICFAKAEHVIDWLKEPAKWMLGERFEM
jgi:hypothetical protein